MAESQVNPKKTPACSQVELVGADHRFAKYGPALAEFIPLHDAALHEASPSVSDASSARSEGTPVLVSEALCSTVPALAAADVGQPDEASAMSDCDSLSLGSGGNVSPLRDEERDLLDGRSWVEEMDHQVALPVQTSLSEALVSSVCLLYTSPSPRDS